MTMKGDIIQVKEALDLVLDNWDVMPDEDKKKLLTTHSNLLDIY